MSISKRTLNHYQLLIVLAVRVTFGMVGLSCEGVLVMLQMCHKTAYNCVVRMTRYGSYCYGCLLLVEPAQAKSDGKFLLCMILGELQKRTETITKICL